jgi:DNA mismatch repair protein MutS2
VRLALREETERLRTEVEAGRRKGLAAEAAERLFAAAPELDGGEPPAEPGELAVGERVRHRLLGWEGVLDKLDRGRAEVAVRGKRVRCKEDELVPVGGDGGKAAAGSSPKGAAASRRRIETPDVDDAPSELHLIGQRIEPALAELDVYLDRALLANRQTVRVVHGHGSGRLRKAVREHLRGHRAVSSHRPGEPEEGGDGATVVTLRG